MDSKKKTMIISSIIVLLLLVVGVTYAFFTYESGTKSDIVTGQIYMNYEETSTISLTGVFPETKEQALARQDENGVFEFTITGRNTSKYPVYYEIDLLDGGVITGKTETSTKILPEHVRIYLERDGEPLVNGVTFKDFNNRRIYVDTVPANQTSNIEHKYTLRMWIDENLTISDTDTSADYTTTEWNDAYTSLKVRVVGDFEYKEVATDASCFEYNVIGDPNVITYDYLTGITLDTSEEKVEACMANMMSNFNSDVSTAQDGYQSFCEGTGTIEEPAFGTVTITELVERLGGYIDTDFFQVVNISFETRYYELNTSEESVNACMEYLLNNTGGEDYSDAQDSYQSFCEGTGTVNGGEDSIFSENMIGAFGYGLIERNVFTQVEKIPQVIEITNYDETCGTDVIIPTYIEGLPVTRIANGTYEVNKYSGSVVIKSGAFINKMLTSVKFPATLKYIGNCSIAYNLIDELTIPDSVTAIGEYAFAGSGISKITIGKNVNTIGSSALLFGIGYSNNILEKIVNKSGKAFDWKNILDPEGKYIVQDPGIVATGTVLYNLFGSREIQITSE